MCLQNARFIAVILLISSLLGIFAFLLRIAYLTLVERAILGLMQNRRSPTKRGLGGLLQPLLDGVKLINRALTLPLRGEKRIVILLRWRGFTTLLVLNRLIRWAFNVQRVKAGLILFLFLLGLLTLLRLVRALRSGSSYRSLGSLRFVVTSLSFEPLIMLLVLSFIYLGKRIKISLTWLLLGFPLILSFLLMVVSIEASRAPLEFVEGERELVRGFNTEIRRTPFIFTFLTEYGLLIFYSILIRQFAFGGNSLIGALTLLSLLRIRAWYPRFRYDKGIRLRWFLLLPFLTLFLLALFLG